MAVNIEFAQFPNVDDWEKMLIGATNYSERIQEKYIYNALTSLHPTLQQAWWRIMKQVIYAYSDGADNGAFSVDARNMDAVEYVKRLTDSNAKFVGLPVV